MFSPYLITYPSTEHMLPSMPILKPCEEKGPKFSSNSDLPKITDFSNIYTLVKQSL